MGDVLQLIDLDADGQPVVVKDLNALVADRGYYLERDTLQLSPGARERRLSQVSGRYGGQRQVGEARDNATLSATFAVKGGAYGTVESDKVMGDAESLAGLFDAPDLVAANRYLLFRPEFASARRRTLWRPMGAADWRPRYIRNAFTGGNVMALELTVPIAPKSFGLPLDNRETLYDPNRFADQWSKLNGAVPFSFSAGMFMSGGDTATSVVALQDRRGEQAGDREILAAFQWDGGTDAAVRGLGVVLKGRDVNNWLAVFVRARAGGNADPVYLGNMVGGSYAEASVGGTFPTDLPATTTFWLRARLTGSTLTVDLFNQVARPNEGTTPTGSLNPVDISTLGVAGDPAGNWGADKAGWGGLLFKGAESSNWKAAEYIDRPYTYRSLAPSSAGSTPIYKVPGTVDADAEAEVYHRSSNRPRYALLGWRRRGKNPASSPSFGFVNAGSGWTGDGAQATALGANFLDGDAYSFTLSSAGASGLRAAIDGRYDTYAADAFAGPIIPLAVFARCEIPSTMVAPRLAVSMEATPGTPATRVYALDTGIAGRAVPVPSAGTARRFFPVGVVLVDTRMEVDQRLGFDLSYGPGSSGTFRIDYALVVPTRQSAYSPTGKDSASYPDFMNAANRVKRIAVDLTARSRSVAQEDTQRAMAAGLGGARLELACDRNDFVFKASDLIPDDPAAGASSEDASPTFDVHFAITPSYRLWSDA